MHIDRGEGLFFMPKCLSQKTSNPVSPHRLLQNPLRDGDSNPTSTIFCVDHLEVLGLKTLKGAKSKVFPLQQPRSLRKITSH